MAVLTMLMLAMTACSSDDDMNYAGIIVNFTLQDESGIEKYVFKEGENIIFKLAITNNSEEEAHLLNQSDMLVPSDIFHVYSSSAGDFGQPFDCLLLTAIGGPLFLPSKSTYTFLCPWINNPDTKITWDSDGYGHPYGYDNMAINKFRPLPKGEYYSKFPLRLDEKKIVTCNKSFIIE